MTGVGPYYDFGVAVPDASPGLKNRTEHACGRRRRRRIDHPVRSLRGREVAVVASTVMDGKVPSKLA